jgi:hypothetical protein
VVRWLHAVFVHQIHLLAADQCTATVAVDVAYTAFQAVADDAEIDR